MKRESDAACLLINPELRFKLKATFESLTVMLKEEIKSCYYYRADNKRIELEKQAHDFIVTTLASNEKRVIFNRVISLNNRLFYLTEILFKEILEVINLRSFEISEHNQWRLKFKINEYLLSECKIE